MKHTICPACNGVGWERFVWKVKQAYKFRRKFWCWRRGLNPRPPVYKEGALPLGYIGNLLGRKDFIAGSSNFIDGLTDECLKKDLGLFHL